MTHPAEAWYQDPTVWVATGFALFMAVFFRYVWPKVSAGLDSRAQAITDQLAQATKLRQEAQMVLDNFKVKQVLIYSTSGSLVKNAGTSNSINIANLAKGFYVLHIQFSDNQITTAKFIKQ